MLFVRFDGFETAVQAEIINDFEHACNNEI